MEGRVLTMNSLARDWVGVYGDSTQAQALKSWAAGLQTGETIAPGLAAIDETTTLQMQDKFIHVQAMTLRSISDQDAGIILMLQDVTAVKSQSDRHDDVIKEITQSVHIVEKPKVITGKPLEPQHSIETVADQLKDDTRALQRMIDAYHEMTVLQPGELRQQPVEMRQLLTYLHHEWRPLARAAEIDLTVQLPEGEIFVLGEEKRLRMALGNLLDNSLKYALAGAAIQIATEADDSHLTLTIEDSGVGITREELPHVFTRFYRGKPTAPDGKRLIVPGQGQGLYLARQVTAAHGGAITLHSAPGQGTRVMVILPLTADVSLYIEPDVRSYWDEPTSVRLERH
jgi:signal transduction histidine kinase